MNVDYIVDYIKVEMYDIEGKYIKIKGKINEKIYKDSKYCKKNV